MNRRQRITSGMVAAIVTASTTPARAQAGNDQDLVGSWFGTITATNPALGQFNDLISFHTGGVVTESRRYLVPGTPLGNLLETRATGRGGGRAGTRSRPSSAFSCRTSTPARRSARTTSACR